MPRKTLPEAPSVNNRQNVSFEISTSILQRWNPAVRAAAESEDDNTISILDEIGEDYWTGEGVTAKRIGAALRSIGAKNPVTVNINSPGGDYFEGLAIYNLLRAHEGEVTIRILGVAASAASVIAMAGDTVQIGRAAFLMIHNAWIVAVGNRHDLRDAADWIEPFDKVAAEIYVARTGLDADTVEQMMDSESWIGGADAINKGLADEFLPADQAVEIESGSPQSSVRQVDLMLAKQGIPRSERRRLIKDIKSSTPDAAGNGTQDATASNAHNAIRTVSFGEATELLASFEALAKKELLT
ncbi:head maturation protease, ClpP-related [Orrella sp. 11846]|uniref:head maturation protease, ClpP-related n=1 Tax=Orrella sp. 11846 TaxID=3409913 RepID=UPI003B5AAC8E